MIQLSATLEKRKLIPGPIRYDMHPIGWLEILSIRQVLQQPMMVTPQGDSNLVRAYEDLASCWDSPDQARFDQVFDAACDAYINDCTMERERTDGSRGVSTWLRPYGLQCFVRGRMEKGLDAPSLNHPVFSHVPSHDLLAVAEVPKLPSEVSETLHLLDRLSDKALFED